MMTHTALGLRIWLASIGILGLVTCDGAQAQQASPSSEQGADSAIPNNNQDFTRPENLIQLRNVLQTALGSGSAPGTIRTVTRDTTVLRTDYKFNIAPQWTVALRYAAEFKRSDETLTAFVKRKGGINKCASRFARRLGRAAQKS